MALPDVTGSARWLRWPGRQRADPGAAPDRDAGRTARCRAGSRRRDGPPRSRCWPAGGLRTAGPPPTSAAPSPASCPSPTRPRSAPSCPAADGTCPECSICDQFSRMITTEINRVSDRMTAVVMVRRIDDAGGLRTPSRQQAPLATATKATGEPGTPQIGINGMTKYAEDRLHELRSLDLKRLGSRRPGHTWGTLAVRNRQVHGTGRSVVCVIVVGSKPRDAAWLKLPAALQAVMSATRGACAGQGAFAVCSCCCRSQNLSVIGGALRFRQYLVMTNLRCCHIPHLWWRESTGL